MADDVINENVAEEEKPKKQSAKERKAEKKQARADKKETARLKKEWEDSIVVSKKVKAEEHRRKLKRAMLILLVFSLIVTSIVYIMLLFIQENNVRITVSNRTDENIISLSMDNENWTPYLNAVGPDNIWNISYSREYDTESGDVIKTLDEVRAFISMDNIPEDLSPSVGDSSGVGDGSGESGEEREWFRLGAMNGTNYIGFAFMLKNLGENDASLRYEMTLETDSGDHDLHEAVRVIWGESYRLDHTGENTTVECYAALSSNPRLAGTRINLDRTEEDGYLEYIAYPKGSFTPGEPLYDLLAYENGRPAGQGGPVIKGIYESGNDNARVEAERNGYIATVPFHSDDFIFQKESVLKQGDIMYCYVCIWLEGSDFDCIDSAIGGYCKIGINFVAG